MLFVFECTFRMCLSSRTTFFARLANCRVDSVSAAAFIAGEIQTMKQILELPQRESIKTLKLQLRKIHITAEYLVNFELLNGICVLFESTRAVIQCPSADRLPLIEVSSWILKSLSSFEIFLGMENFSEPARSTILNYYELLRVLKQLSPTFENTGFAL